MSDAIGSVRGSPAPVEVQAKQARGDTPPAQESPPIPKDSVQLSSALQAALQEAVETPAQTAKEAHNGDHQAKVLLAKQAAAKADVEKTVSRPPVHVVA